ncbi:MAG TPA: ECF-type sigma factor [Thermoanaerobaculia bacterium]|jgi:RNA polymerase sigma factor (TIGR02999 family)|nr:ECF-type sigma factor [Thermoanaerobaculia bacterium]
MVRPEGALEDPAAEPITSWVAAARAGDREAADRLYRAVYNQLRRIASAQRTRLGSGNTLSTTVVVHELYLRLEQAERLTVADRHHFFSLAARIMRQILIDDVRRRVAGRRGAGAHLTALDDQDLVAPQRPEQWLALDEALDGLAAQDADLARLVELHFFAGLPFALIAGLVDSSERTVRRQWRRARAFLYDRMTRPA